MGAATLGAQPTKIVSVDKKNLKDSLAQSVQKLADEFDVGVFTFDPQSFVKHTRRSPDCGGTKYVDDVEAAPSCGA